MFPRPPIDDKEALALLTHRIKKSEDQSFIVQDHRDPSEKAAAGNFGPMSTLMKQFHLNIAQPLKPLNKRAVEPNSARNAAEASNYGSTGQFNEWTGDRYAKGSARGPSLQGFANEIFETSGYAKLPQIK